MVLPPLHCEPSLLQAPQLLQLLLRTRQPPILQTADEAGSAGLPLVGLSSSTRASASGRKGTRSCFLAAWGRTWVRPLKGTQEIIVELINRK